MSTGKIKAIVNMQDRVQISCINKRGNHYNPHERISHIGGMSNGRRWRLTEDQAINAIEQGKYNFYVSTNGRTVDVIVALHLGRKYLKTVVDDYSPDNLLSLNECPLI